MRTSSSTASRGSTARGHQEGARDGGASNAIVAEHLGLPHERARKIVAAGGVTTTEHVALVPIDTAVVLTYPYRRWIPWTTTIIGLGVAAAGGATWLLGRNSMSQFNADYATQRRAGCETGLTSPAHHALASEPRQRAAQVVKIGVAMMAGGGVVAITGIVLAIMNRADPQAADGRGRAAGRRCDRDARLVVLITSWA